MYCPNCEFEIKQDVTECPICGGELILHPEEPKDTQPASSASADEQPPDLSISNLIMGAKQELGSFENEPAVTAHDKDPEAEDIDFGSLLSSDSRDASPADIEPLDAEANIFDTPPKGPKKDTTNFPPAGSDTGPDEGYDLFKEDSGMPEKPQPEEHDTAGPDLFADDTPVKDARRPRTLPEQDTTSFIDELSGKKLAHALNSMSVPPPKSAPPGQYPDMQNATARQSTDSITVIPAGQELLDEAQGAAITSSDGGGSGFSLNALDETAEGTGSRSTLRLIILILAVAAIAVGGAYFLTTNFLRTTVPPGDIREHTAPARPVPPAARTEPRTPSAPAGEPSETPPPQEETAPEAPGQGAPPAATLSGTSSRQAVTAPPVTSTPEEISDDADAAQRRAEQAASQPQKQQAAPAPPQDGIREASPPAPAQPRSNAAAPYSVHVFSFKTRQAARAEIRRLRDLDFDAYLETVDLERKGIWHRVKVGHYATRAEAEKARRDIKRRYPDIEPLIHLNK